MELTLKLTIEQVNMVLASLGKQPYEVVFPLIEQIRTQLEPQLKKGEETF